ncbi:MAG TPA: hypothetical protein VFX24_12620, partial [Ktedonobacterales bacterium]|nr:hypothetical protein [Ktedonobacterales bacterium]
MRQSEVEETQRQRLPISHRVSKLLSQWPQLRLAGYLLAALVVLLIVQNALLALTAEPLRLVIAPA